MLDENKTIIRNVDLTANWSKMSKYWNKLKIYIVLYYLVF